MLDQNTKRKIDRCRDILVGKVPDPKSQVEQITIALIYKFMDDMDKESLELGGLAKFFSGEFEKYAWSKIFDPRISGYELITLYSEAIAKMNHNNNIPQLFRDIFKNAFLPYRDPETLKSFLKEINEFSYEHSEKLGDAFEYLLSVLGSQGDAGQFRTPRHIIDFIVSVIEPEKNETILDPACGTAGFLISSYKYIMKQNTKNRPGDGLTLDDRKKLMDNFVGYDISPDMVRLSLVNMYLHNFPIPKIYEYDTLTSEDKWSENYDVILANPPFMTPKGGIRPHKRFSVQAKRSEVLFVDYIVEHLNVNGRAGVIVPEGIIFQSANAYKSLRKLLVDRCLFAVVSLPAGIFQPYSGVKTSILLLDKNLSKKSKSILFVKVENDGFELGAQRREFDKNDLPKAFDVILKYKKSLQDGNEFELNDEIGHIVLKSKIGESGDYNLSGERYKEVLVKKNKEWEMVELGDIAEIILGQSPEGKYYNDKGEGLPFYQGKTDFGDIYLKNPTNWTNQITKTADKDDILISVRAPVGPVNLSPFKICIGRGLASIRPHKDLNYLFLFYILRESQDRIKNYGNGSTFEAINREQIKKLKIPLPPLSVQQEIVAEIEGYQKIIDGAGQVVENYKPKIKVEEEWEMVELGEVADVFNGITSPKEDYQDEGIIKVIKVKDYNEYDIYYNKNERGWLKKDIDSEKILQQGDTLIINAAHNASHVGGKIGFCKNKPPMKCLPSGEVMIIRAKKIQPLFLNTLIKSEAFRKRIREKVNGIHLYPKDVKTIKIPLPPLSVQQEIVAEIEEEQKLIEANKKLIELFEGKIKKKIAEVWD